MDFSDIGPAMTQAGQDDKIKKLEDRIAALETKISKLNEATERSLVAIVDLIDRVLSLVR